MSSVLLIAIAILLLDCLALERTDHPQPPHAPLNLPRVRHGITTPNPDDEKPLLADQKRLIRILWIPKNTARTQCRDRRLQHIVMERVHDQIPNRTAHRHAHPSAWDIQQHSHTPWRM